MTVPYPKRPQVERKSDYTSLGALKFSCVLDVVVVLAEIFIFIAWGGWIAPTFAVFWAVWFALRDLPRYRSAQRYHDKLDEYNKQADEWHKASIRSMFDKNYHE